MDAAREQVHSGVQRVETLWRGLVRVTPETFWMRETSTEGRFANFFLGGKNDTSLSPNEAEREGQAAVNPRPASSR